MNILLLGASGRVGSHIASFAARDGHHIKLLVRNPDKVQLQGENVTIVKGNALNAQDLGLAIQGVDAVISALSTDGGTTLSDSMPLLIQAMKLGGVRRIVTIGTAGILQSRTSPDLLRYQSSESKRTLTRAAEEHHKAYDVLRLSELDWTMVCPTYLPDGEYTGTYRVAKDLLPVEGKEISVPDTAEFAYKQLTDLAFVKCRVGIAY